MPDLIPPLKRCPDCGVEKPTSQSGRNKCRDDGLAQYCKECFRHRSKASYRKRMAERGKPVRERPEVAERFKYRPQCEEVKPAEAFGRNKANESGLTDYCRPCHNRVMAENKAKNHGSTRSYFLKRATVSRRTMSQNSAAHRLVSVSFACTLVRCTSIMIT